MAASACACIAAVLAAEGGAAAPDKSAVAAAAVAGVAVAGTACAMASELRKEFMLNSGLNPKGLACAPAAAGRAAGNVVADADAAAVRLCSLRMSDSSCLR